MPKRRRLLNSPRKSPRINTTKAPRDDNIEESPKLEREVRTARGRFMGALLEALEAESDDERYHTPHKKKEKEVSEDEDSDSKHTHQRQTYVLKLFDRSVDLSQFKEDTPLYPICRAWIKNQPKANYHVTSKHESPKAETQLPPPQGPLVPRVPPLLPEQVASSKDNINLDYLPSEAPSLEHLLSGHRGRWGAVRRAWLAQGAAVERRYDASQRALNAMNNL
ncbi:unnamed protein product [Plutella xylostella]|uniref:(diamondback moth) hypothetical protein n=1 Tax=Plutella xylostella TaxID=51655 RepID=A0A8S4DK11_PLUXY|nr:unnamed protein product [Plutella xylostella]